MVTHHMLIAYTIGSMRDSGKTAAVSPMFQTQNLPTEHLMFAHSADYVATYGDSLMNLKHHACPSADQLNTRLSPHHILDGHQPTLLHY